jgi:hypothetical protein
MQYFHHDRVLQSNEEPKGNTMRGIAILGLAAALVLGSFGCQAALTQANRGILLGGETFFLGFQPLQPEPIPGEWLRPGAGRRGGLRSAKYARIEFVDDRLLVDDWEHAMLWDRPTWLSRLLTR